MILKFTSFYRILFFENLTVGLHILIALNIQVKFHVNLMLFNT